MGKDQSDWTPSLRPGAETPAGASAAARWGGCGRDEAELSTLDWLDWPRTWAALRRYWPVIALLIVVATSLTAIVVGRLPRMYAATAVVRVDPGAPTNVVGENAEASPLPPNADVLIATEASQARGDAVVTPTILKLRLENAPEFAALADAPSAGAPVSAAMLAAFRGRMDAAQEPFTYLLDLSFRSRSPQLAAATANELARQLLAHEYSSRAAALLASSRYMAGQLDDLRATMERSQQRLNEFVAANHLLNPEDQSNVMNQRLALLAADLEAARERGRAAAADVVLARLGGEEALAATPRGAGLKPLLDAQKAEEIRMADLAAKYGPGDYLFRQERRRLEEVNAAVARASARLETELDAERTAAAARARLTAAAFARQKRAVAAWNAKAVRYGILKNEADADLGLYGDLLRRFKSAQIAAGYHAGDLRVVDWAQPDPRPVSPRPWLAVGLALALSALAGVCGALVAGRLDRALTDAGAARLWLGEAVLASLPAARARADLQLPPAPRGGGQTGGPGGGTAEGQAGGSAEWRGEGEVARAGARLEGGAARRSAFSESVLTLRTALLLGADRRPGVISITSSQPREGKSTVAANLAAAFARQGARTLLVDADLRRPEAHRILGGSNRRGLGTLLRGDCDWRQAAQSSGVPLLWLMAAGPAVSDEPELLARGFSAALELLRAHFDVVVVDCPPLLGFSDALTIAAAVDEVLVVVRAGATPREFVLQALEQLRQVRARVGGVILNGVSSRLSAYYDYYRETARPSGRRWRRPARGARLGGGGGGRGGERGGFRGRGGARDGAPGGTEDGTGERGGDGAGVFRGGRDAARGRRGGRREMTRMWRRGPFLAAVMAGMPGFVALLLLAAAPTMLRAQAAGQSGGAGGGEAGGGTGGEAAASSALAPGEGLPVPADYRIGRGDVLGLSALGMPELSATVAVDGGGEVRPGYLRRPVGAAGRSPGQVAAALAAELRAERIALDPQIEVTVRRIRSHAITVSGEVRRPQVIEAERPLTLLEALLRAGGADARAGDEVVVTHRDAAGRSEAHSYALRALEAGDDPAANPMLGDGDFVNVPPAGQVFVAGAVTQPGAFPLSGDETLTLAGAVALARGWTASARPDHAVLVRRTKEGTRTVAVNLRRVFARREADVELRANDILYIPDSGARNGGIFALKSLATTAAVALGYAVVR